ncbi:hypothetical protein DOE51_10685 [Bdellovibrio sp. NC01]|nr:hypothetical protein DOE51_10685 [Bdellovibrio sp. NC01]
MIDAGTIAINGGATSTNDMNVTLTLNRMFVSQMKISNTPDCSCGTWEPVATSKAWTLGSANKSNTVSVQFKDYDGGVSFCASANILHDNLPPQVTLTAASGNSYQTGTNNVFNYQASDAGVGVKSVSCLLDGQAVACAGISGAITAANASAGVHKVTVTAIDNLNQSGQAYLNFTITSPYREITQTKAVTADNKVDILVVVDNSPSMQDVQKSMAKRVSSLMEQVKNLDYRIAVTTTDPSNKTYGDGRLLPLTGFTNQYVITPAMGLANAQTALSNTVQRPETGSASEQGIYVTYRVIERAIAGETNQKNFFRSDAAFSVILISDADESATAYKNIPKNLISLVNTNWPSKKFIFNSIIVRPGDKACYNEGREAYGPTYDALSRLLGYGTVGGSIIGTVCASDYGAQLAGIGQSVSQMVKTMDLDCAPIGSTTASVIVMKDGSNYTDSYEVQGLKLVFQNNLPAGSYTLSYRCQ